MNKTINKRKLTGVVAGTVAAALLLTMSFAFFSDRESKNASTGTGKFDIALDTTNVVMTDAEGLNVFIPGDIRQVGYTVSNVGQISADVRETLKVSAAGQDFTGFTGTASTQSEFDIYNSTDVEVVNGAYVPKADAQPLSVKSVAGNVITYAAPEYVLSGGMTGGADLQVEAGKAATQTHSYVLLFNKNAGNELQMSNVALDILVEAKQHRNTNDSWAEISTHNFTFMGTGETVQAVDSLNDKVLTVYRNTMPLFTAGADMSAVNIVLGQNMPATLTAQKFYTNKPVVINSVSSELTDYVTIADNTLKVTEGATVNSVINGTVNTTIDGAEYTIKVVVMPVMQA